MTVLTAPPLLSADDLHWFNEGTHRRLWERLGAHPVVVDGIEGTTFAVWAPNAVSVGVIADSNGWDDGQTKLAPLASSGIWTGFVPGVGPGERYKFRVRPRHGPAVFEKADPFALATEVPPATASVVADLAYEWGDREWMASRRSRQSVGAPVAVYELHLGSWRRHADGTSLSYRELAEPLVEHVRHHGFTHVEFLPVMEHPFAGSWGYQTTAYFAPTSRFGAPQDFMYLVDTLHQHGIGVILDWVPSHFPTDGHALGYFDGTHLFEHADPRQGFHPDWDTWIFNYGRNEVRSFLLSSAHFWLDRYHADGLRVDAVASMLYLDYSREEGQWIPNVYGGNENLDALSFLRELNRSVYEQFPDVQTIAEESTAWPMVSRPVDMGGLGFGFKWDMGWMHDWLRYFGREPIYRAWHHHDLTFRAIYQFTENYVLPLSHDEVVHGKGSLLARMPGDPWQQLANLRLLLGLMGGQPGKKLLFMGAELAAPNEWNHDGSLPWELADDRGHAGVGRWLGDVNRLYGARPALHELDCEAGGFEWVEADDARNSVIAWLRRARDGSEILVVGNCTPVPRHNYRVGVNRAGAWREVLNSDAADYGGSGIGNLGRVTASPLPHAGRDFSLVLTLPPLGCLFLEPTEP